MWRSGSISMNLPLSWRQAPPSPPLLNSKIFSDSAKGSHRHLRPHFRSKSVPPPSVQCVLNPGAGSGDDLSPSRKPSSEVELEEEKGLWSKWKASSAEMSSKLAKLGLAAVLAYGLFDGVTYTTFFVLAFLGYEKSTGKNPAANLQALLGIVILMWTGNNVTRPFRVAGAAALAPLIDRGLKRIQSYSPALSMHLLLLPPLGLRPAEQ